MKASRRNLFLSVCTHIHFVSENNERSPMQAGVHNAHKNMFGEFSFGLEA
jgi:hypothetical protein